MVTSAVELKDAPWKKSYDKPRQDIKKQRHAFGWQRYGFSNSHVWMWELDHKEAWAPQNWCFWTVVLEKTLENPLDCKEMRQSILMEINSEYLLEGLMLKLQYFGHPMQRADLLEKILMPGKTEGKRRSRGRDGQTASLTQWTWIWANFGRQWRTEEGCGPWGHRELGMT